MLYSYNKKYIYINEFSKCQKGNKDIELISSINLISSFIAVKPFK